MSSRVLVIAGQAGSLINFRGALLSAMMRAGHVVHAAAPDMAGDHATRTRLQEMGVQTHAFGLSRNGLNPLADLATFRDLYRTIRRLRPDVVLSYTIKPVVWGGLAARLSGVPRFFALITGLGYAFTGPARGKRALVRKMAATLYRISLTRARGVILQNPDDEAELRARGILRPKTASFVVDGSGVDLDHFRRVPLPEGPTCFVMIGRLLGDKGVREYAAAAAALRRAGQNMRILLVGDTDSNADSITAAEAQAWHDDGRLEWLGALPDVRPAIAAAHVVVLPSYREGVPRSLLEGMAMGRALVTTDAPGCRETVRPGLNGDLVPIADSRALADAMQRFIDEPARAERMGQASYDMACARFDVRKVNARMLEIMGLA